MKMWVVLFAFCGLQAQAHECSESIQKVVAQHMFARKEPVKFFEKLDIQTLTQGSYWQKYAVNATMMTVDGEWVDMKFILSADFICEGMKVEAAD